MSGGLLIPPGPVRVLVATKPVEFRKGMSATTDSLPNDLESLRVLGYAAAELAPIFRRLRPMTLVCNGRSMGDLEFRRPRNPSALMLDAPRPCAV
jgi:hypothetical protein